MHNVGIVSGEPVKRLSHTYTCNPFSPKLPSHIVLAFLIAIRSWVSPCCRKGDPFEGLRGGSRVTLGNELFQETPVLTKQETWLGRPPPPAPTPEGGQEGEGIQEDCCATWLTVLGFLVTGFVRWLSSASHSDSGSFLGAPASFSRGGCQCSQLDMCGILCLCDVTSRGFPIHSLADYATKLWGFTSSSAGKESACNAEGPQFNSWVRKICWWRDRLSTPGFLGFPCGSAGKESICNEGDLGSIPGLGRSPGEWKGCPLQYLDWRISWTL